MEERVVDIGVIGGGSLGLLVSSYLSLKHDVTLYVKRQAQKKCINNEGIKLKLANKVERKANVNCQLIDNLRNHELIFVAVKQPQINEVINQLRKNNLSPHLIFLQNGMGHIDKIMTLAGDVSVGVVEHGATRLNDSEVNHLGRGVIKLATLKGEANTLRYFKRKLHSDSFPFKVKEDWESLLKSKLLINAVINPLTALFDVSNGVIVSNAHLRKLAKKLSDETAFVLKFNKDKAWNDVQRVARNTANNTSSMRADIIHNRETEIEAISGYVLKNTNYKKVPYTSFVYEAILALQNCKSKGTLP